MSKAKPLNIKTTGSVIFIIALIVIMQNYSSDIKEPLKIILESKWIGIAIWAYVGGTFVIYHYLYSSNELQKNSFIFKHFGIYADTLFGIGTYGLAGTTSLALLKGLYLQAFYEGKFFSGFATFDLVSMFLLTSFLLVYCMFNTTIMFKDILFHRETSSIVVK